MFVFQHIFELNRQLPQQHSTATTLTRRISGSINNVSVDAITATTGYVERWLGSDVSLHTQIPVGVLTGTMEDYIFI